MAKSSAAFYCFKTSYRVHKYDDMKRLTENMLLDNSLPSIYERNLFKASKFHDQNLLGGGNTLGNRNDIKQPPALLYLMEEGIRQGDQEKLLHSIKLLKNNSFQLDSVYLVNKLASYLKLGHITHFAKAKIAEEILFNLIILLISSSDSFREQEKNSLAKQLKSIETNKESLGGFELEYYIEICLLFLQHYSIRKNRISNEKGYYVACMILNRNLFLDKIKIEYLSSFSEHQRRVKHKIKSESLNTYFQIQKSIHELNLLKGADYFSQIVEKCKVFLYESSDLLKIGVLLGIKKLILKELPIFYVKDILKEALDSPSLREFARNVLCEIIVIKGSSFHDYAIEELELEKSFEISEEFRSCVEMYTNLGAVNKEYAQEIDNIDNLSPKLLNNSHVFTEVECFLDDKSKHILLLIGKEGTGKTLICKKIVYKLLNSYENTYVPVYVRHHDAIYFQYAADEHLGNCGFDGPFKELTNFLFLLDGFEKFTAKDEFKIVNDLLSRFQNSKILISSKKFQDPVNFYKKIHELILKTDLFPYKEYFQRINRDDLVSMGYQYPKLTYLWENPLTCVYFCDISLKNIQLEHISKAVIFSEYLKSYEIDSKEYEKYAFEEHIYSFITDPSHFFLLECISECKYVFVHRSWKLYFIALKIIDILNGLGNKYHLKMINLSELKGIYKFLNEILEQRHQIEIIKLINAHKSKPDCKEIVVNLIKILKKSKFSSGKYHFPGLDLSETSYRYLNLSGIDIQSTNMKSVSLQNSVLANCDLTNSNLLQSRLHFTKKRIFSHLNNSQTYATNGNLLAMSKNLRLNIWNLSIKELEQVIVLPYKPEIIKISNNNRFIVIIDIKNKLSVYKDRQLANSIPFEMWKNIDFVISTDSEQICCLVTQNSYHQLSIRDINNGNTLSLIDLENSQSLSPIVCINSLNICLYTNHYDEVWMVKNYTKKWHSSTRLFEEVRSHAVSRDGSTLAILSNKQIDIWKSNHKKVIKRLMNEEHTKKIDISRDSNYLALYCKGDIFVILNTETGLVINKTRIKSDYLDKIINTDDSFLFLISGSASITYNFTKNRFSILNDKFISREIKSLDVSANYIAIGTAFYGVSIVNIDSGRQKYHVETSNAVFVLKISKDERFIAFSYWDGKVHLNSLQNDEQSCTIYVSLQEVQAICFSDTYVAFFDKDTIQIYRCETVYLIADLRYGDSKINSICFTDNEDFIVSGHEDASIVLWDIPNQTIVYTLQHGLEPIKALVCFAERIVSLSTYCKIYIWDIRQKKLIYNIESSSNYAYLAEIHPSRGLIAISSFRKSIDIRDIETGILVSRLQGNGTAINCMKFTKDGKQLVSASISGDVRLWKLKENCLISNA